MNDTKQNDAHENHEAAAHLLPVLLTPQLNSGEIELTTACPCRCVTCGSNCGRAADNELVTDEIIRVLRDLRELGCERTTFLGGEPLCRPDLLTLIKEGRTLGLVVEIVTSGMGLDAEFAGQLKAAGINSVTVSVDGLEPSHDMQRGVKGSFCRAINAISALKIARVPVGVNTQVNRVSLPELESMGDVLLEAGAIGWQLQTTLPMGRAANSPLILREGDMPELLNVVRRLIRRPKLAPHITDAIGWWTSDDAQLRSTRGGMSRCWLGCFAGLRHVGVTSRGDVKGCLALTDDFIEGNVRQSSLRDIWDDTSRFAYNRAYRQESLSGACATCTQALLCRAGCTASSVAYHGKTGINANCLFLVEQRGGASTLQ